MGIQASLLDEDETVRSLVQEAKSRLEFAMSKVGQPAHDHCP